MINAGLVAVVKHGGAFLVSSGVSTMVGYAAKASVPKVAPHIIRHIPAAAKGWHLFQKVAIPAGAAALAGLASEQAVKYSDKKIDETVKDIEKLKADMDTYAEKVAQRKTAQKQEPATESSESD